MELYRVSEVAAELRVTPSAVYQWIKAGKIAPVRIGSKIVRISKEELSNFLLREQAQEKG